MSPTNRSTSEGNLRLDPPYFTEKKANKTLSKRQSIAFIDDMDKTHYSISLYNATGRVYLTDGNTGNNVKINSVRVLRQEV
ncbi:hypothetical protein [Spiroplasma phoeniceum]|uniref:Uncharacterized protein n=1 Tax=Spiroplasma phoeniceum P40 TaxID=1276259 RepID=A0A345DQ65_9MOLU|nr:hypothetical protein [Spiroplasma phoeniceum]AXF96353.1 hypothetical protein SDAV_001386 [Spiroplasma phoeniceum P40]